MPQFRGLNIHGSEDEANQAEADRVRQCIDATLCVACHAPRDAGENLCGPCLEHEEKDND